MWVALISVSQSTIAFPLQQRFFRGSVATSLFYIFVFLKIGGDVLSCP